HIHGFVLENAPEILHELAPASLRPRDHLLRVGLLPRIRIAQVSNLHVFTRGKHPDQGCPAPAATHQAPDDLVIGGSASGLVETRIRSRRADGLLDELTTI